MEHIRSIFIKSLTVTVLILLTVISSLAQTPEDLYQRFEDSMVSKNGQATSYDFSWVTPQIREELIQYASTTNSNNLPRPQFITPKEALLYLGDPATIEEAVSDYRKADGRQNMWGPPDVLPYLVDDLTHASSEDHLHVLGRYPLMDTSLMSSFAIIYQWTPFPAETRKWAGDQSSRLGGLYYRLGPDSNAIRIMKEWWEHNKEAVLARQYDKAAWLPPASEQVPDGFMAQLPSTPSSVTPSQPAVTPAPAPQTLPSNHTGIPFWLYGILALIIGALAGLWYFLRAKK